MEIEIRNTEAAVPETPARLSIVLATRFDAPLITPTIDSLVVGLTQGNDPIGSELIVVDGGSKDGTVERIEERAEKLREAGKFQMVRFGGEDRVLPVLHKALLRNEGVRVSQGSFLSFVEPGDVWPSDRLRALEPSLKKHDLILGTSETGPIPSDWLAALLERNWVTPGSGVIRRALLDSIGGYPMGLGEGEYALWLKALAWLSKNHSAETSAWDRLAVLPTPTGFRSSHGTRVDEMLPTPVRSARRWISVVESSRKLPLRYLVRTIASVIKK